MLKKIVFSILLFCFSFAVVAPQFALAQTPSPAPILNEIGPWYNQSFFQWRNRVYDESNPTEIFGERYTAAQVSWIIYGLIAFLEERVLGPGISNCINNPNFLNCVNNLFSGGGAYVIPDPYEKQGLLALIIKKDKPISAVSYFKNVLRKLQNSVPEAHAQETGFGFRGLNVIQDIWRSVRNISYALFALIIIITAFMIMFRVKISPQTIITVQSALPKIALALILITFSYPIAGLLVDLMYVVIGIISLFFQTAPALGGNAAYYFGVMVNGPLNLGVLGFAVLYLTHFLIIYLAIVIFGPFATVAAGGAGVIPGAIIQLVLTPVMLVIGIIVFIILIFALIWQTLKIAWLLIKTFVALLLQVIIAPLQIAIGIVYPGIGFGTWLKSLAANLAVFPLVGTMYIIAFWFLYIALQMGTAQLGDIGGIGSMVCQFTRGPNADCDWVPDFYGGWPPLMGTDRYMFSFVLLMASFVVLTMISKAADLIKSFISGRPMAFGTGLGEAVGPTGLAAIAGGVGWGAERLQAWAPIAGRGWAIKTVQQATEAIQKAVLSQKV